MWTRISTTCVLFIGGHQWNSDLRCNHYRDWLPDHWARVQPLWLLVWSQPILPVFRIVQPKHINLRLILLGHLLGENRGRDLHVLERLFQFFMDFLGLLQLLVDLLPYWIRRGDLQIRRGPPLIKFKRAVMARRIIILWRTSRIRKISSSR